MTMRFRLKTVVGAGLSGAAAMWLFDPDRGSQRRNQLKDQVRSRVNRSKREVSGKVHQQQTQLANAVHRLNHRGQSEPADDQVLVDRIKSEVLGRERYAGLDVLVEANHGVVVLRGQLTDPVDRIDLERDVLAMVGVVALENLLHAQGEDAPNKAEAIHAAG